MVWPAIIGAVGTVAGSMLANRGGLSAGKSYQIQKEFRDEDYERSKVAIQNRVKDARAAGVHPLFALGATSGSVGGTPFIPGQSTSGSALGEGIAQVSRDVAGAMRSKAATAARQPLVQAQIRSANASAARDEASAMEIASRTKRAEQQVIAAPNVNPTIAESPSIPTPARTKGEIFHGPFGGVYQTPVGPTPQGDWEELVGEAADALGVGLGYRMWSDRRRRLIRHDNQRRATIRFRMNVGARERKQMRYQLKAVKRQQRRNRVSRRRSPWR